MARQIKRSIKRRYDEVEPKILESVLTKIDGEHSIHINKNEQTAAKNNKEDLRKIAKLLGDKLQKDIATRQQTIKELEMKIQQIGILVKKVAHMKKEETRKMRKKLENIIELKKNTSTWIENIHQYINNIDNELTCSICSELFLKATILNCSHTFCQYCINNWNKVQMNCPLCREPITAKIGQPILDDFIEKMVENFKLDPKDNRKNIIEKREALEKE